MVKRLYTLRADGQMVGNLVELHYNRSDLGAITLLISLSKVPPLEQLKAGTPIVVVYWGDDLEVDSIEIAKDGIEVV
jgi:hypothetical protein